jgi:cytochrome c553
MAMSSFPRVCLFTAAMALVACARPAAASGHYVTTRNLYSTCVSCHGPEAWGSKDGNIPNIAGQHAAYIEKQIKMFRGGVRRDEAMLAVAEHPEFADPLKIKSLAQQVAKFAPNPHPELGPGENLAEGKDTYDHICAACHGADGGGQAVNAVPRIAGQHYPYLLRQIGAAAALHRDLAPPEMTSGLRALTDRQRSALADYISRLAPAAVPASPPASPPRADE